MKNQSYNELVRPLAEDRREIAMHEREAYGGVLAVSLKNRIELIRDYTVFSTALLAAIVAIFGADNRLGANEHLLYLSGILCLGSIICCFISRMYYIDEGDKHMLNMSHKFAYELGLAQVLKYAETSEEYESSKAKISKPQQHKTVKWKFFVEDTKNIGILIVICLLTLALSLVI